MSNNYFIFIFSSFLASFNAYLYYMAPSTTNNLNISNQMNYTNIEAFFFDKQQLDNNISLYIAAPSIVINDTLNITVDCNLWSEEAIQPIIYFENRGEMRIIGNNISFSLTNFRIFQMSSISNQILYLNDLLYIHIMVYLIIYIICIQYNNFLIILLYIRNVTLLSKIHKMLRI